jgi:Family of unknown function (DUF6518)
MKRPVGLVIGLAAAGVALGVAGRAAAHMPDPFSLSLALGVPWLVVSFAAGFATRDLALGTLAGAGVLMLSVLAYYAVVLFVEERSGPHYAAGMTVLWGFFGALSGALFGLAGAGVARGTTLGRTLGVALLAGALIGEAALYIQAGRDGGIEGTLLTGQLFLGIALPLVAIRPARLVLPAIALTWLVSGVALYADEAIRTFARAHGWGA